MATPTRAVVTLAADILRKAAACVLRGWTQGQMARDANGVPLPVEHAHALQFCATGSLQRVGNETTPHAPAWGEAYTEHASAMMLAQHSLELFVDATTGHAILSAWNDSLPAKTGQVAVATTMEAVAALLTAQAAALTADA